MAGQEDGGGRDGGQCRDDTAARVTTDGELIHSHLTQLNKIY